jgi:hypothetical protein
MSKIRKVAGFCLFGVGILFLLPVIFGGMALTGIGGCAVPAFILVGIGLVLS